MTRALQLYGYSLSYREVARRVEGKKSESKYTEDGSDREWGEPRAWTHGLFDNSRLSCLS